MPEETKKTNPTKKVFVKVPKKSEDKAVNENKVFSKEFIKEVNNTDDFNKRKKEVEYMAKSDSIVGAKKAKFEGKDIVDQRRAGNNSANVTRVKEGNPQVARGRSMEMENSFDGDKYSSTNSPFKSDYYSRLKPLEKDMPNTKTFVKVPKK
jgi:hypothetical protein